MGKVLIDQKIDVVKLIHIIIIAKWAVDYTTHKNSFEEIKELNR